METQFTRNILMYGEEGLHKLKMATVVVLGIGGVGSYAAEALARTGIGTLILVDKDTIDVTNINRQIHALWSTVGRAKVEVMKERIHDISPNCQVDVLKMFYNTETAEQLFAHSFDYVIDASDTISYKVDIICKCLSKNIPIISVMGSANKCDPTKLQIIDISKTYCDPLAKVIRLQLRKKGITQRVPVVFSPEQPWKPAYKNINMEHKQAEEKAIRKQIYPPASNVMVPATAGLIGASWVINEIVNKKS